MSGTTNRQGVESTTVSAELGDDLHDLIRVVYPICRSITGDGVRQTLAHLAEHIPLEVREVPSGTRVFDWTVPREWTIRDAYVADKEGKRVVDFRKSNLHVLNYSAPVRRRVSLSELKDHTFSLPDHPDWIPYRTSYYHERWGFCMRHRDLEQLADEEYDVVVDSDLRDGHLTYGEYYLKGQTEEEVLVSTHVCHPSLCNDNLSGVSIATHLAKYLTDRKLRYSYRFLFIPGTIGSITWLALNRDNVSRIAHGLVLTCVGDDGRFTYKRSRRGDAEIDRAMAHVLQHSGRDHDLVDFSPYGYDERQYCSPGFNLAVGCLMRTPHGTFPEYHTSADNLELVPPHALRDSFQQVISLVHLLENNRRFLSRNPYCEPQLGTRGLYKAIGGTEAARRELSLLWVLNLADGKHSLLDVAERSGLEFRIVNDAAEALLASGLLEALSD